RPGGVVLWTASCPVLVAVFLLFPVGWAALIAAAGMALGRVLVRQWQPQKLLFNVANVTLSVALGGALWTLGGSQLGLASALAIPWVVLACLVYFATNTLLLAGMVAFVVDLPVGVMWRRGHGSVLLPNVALLASGVAVAGLWLAYPWM